MPATVTTDIKTWQQARIGAGGWITGYDMHVDGTLVCRTDTYGAYLWNTSTSQWDQLVTSNSMPSGDVGVYESSGQLGVYEIRIAPSNSSIFYMGFRGYIYKSTDKGTTWVRTAFSRLSNSIAPNGTINRIMGPHMAIDPQNAAVVMLGTMSNGLFATYDSGATWVVRTDVNVGSGIQASGGSGPLPGVTGVFFDPLASTVSVGGVTTTTIVWASSWNSGATSGGGTYGFYRSTDGGVTWAVPSGAPPTTVVGLGMTSIGDMICCTYVKPAPNKVYKYIKSTDTWSDISSTVTLARTGTQVHSVAIDPFNDNHVIFADDGGALQESTDFAATVGVADLINMTRTATDVMWMGVDAYEVFMSNGRVGFHPTTQNRLMFAEGIGFWYHTLGTGGSSLATLGESYNANWVEMSKGIEQLVAIRTISTPPSTLFPAGHQFYTAWDRPIYVSGNPEVYPSVYFGSTDNGIRRAWGLDYCASNPDILAANISGNSGVQSCYTTNGGTSWTAFPTRPVFTGYDGGCVSVGVTAGNFVWNPGYAQIPYYTTNYGTTWTAVTCPAEIANDATSAGWQGVSGISNTTNRSAICADRVNADTFYMFHVSAGMFKSTDSGATWVRQYTGALPGVTDNAGYALQMSCPPGKAGHAWLTCGDIGGVFGESPAGIFQYTEDGWVTRNTVADVLEVYAFGWGVTKSGASYPTLYIAGSVNGTYGIYYSTDKAVSWTQIGDWPYGNLDRVVSVEGDKVTFGRAYVGFGGSGWAYTSGAAGTLNGMMSLQFRF